MCFYANALTLTYTQILMHIQKTTMATHKHKWTYTLEHQHTNVHAHEHISAHIHTHEHTNEPTQNH